MASILAIVSKEIHAVLSAASGWVSSFDFAPLGLPPPADVRRWAGYAPRGSFEARVAGRPVWHAWHVVDLAPTDAIVKRMIESIASWDNDAQPTQAVIDTIVRCGPICIPHLERAARKKWRDRGVIAKALARLRRGL